MNNLNPKSYILNQLFKELFFGFLAILLIILIYGLFQPDPGFGFFAPYWKKLTLLLGTAVFFGILAVFWRKG
jgi:hypothetical protein